MSSIQYKVSAERSLKSGAIQKVLTFIHELELGDKIAGVLVKVFRSKRNKGWISGLLVKIGDRQSDIGFVPGRYVKEWEEREEEKKRQNPKYRKKKLKPGDEITVEVVAINPRVENYESELILKPAAEETPAD